MCKWQDFSASKLTGEQEESGAGKNVNLHHAFGHDILTRYMVATGHILSEEKTNE